MVFHKNAFLIYHGQIGGRDKIPDMFIQMIVIPFTLAGLINMFMDQVVPHSQQMDGIFLLAPFEAAPAPSAAAAAPPAPGPPAQPGGS